MAEVEREVERRLRRGNIDNIRAWLAAKERRETWIHDHLPKHPSGLVAPANTARDAVLSVGSLGTTTAVSA
jgi:hypothetical protein